MYMLGRYGLAASDDLVHWRDLSSRLKMPRGAKHGSVFEANEGILRGLARE
jgi:hypothetical protein